MMEQVLQVAFYSISALYAALFFRLMAILFQPRFSVRTIMWGSALIDLSLSLFFTNSLSVDVSYFLTFVVVVIELIIFIRYPYGKVVLPIMAGTLYLCLLICCVGIVLSACALTLHLGALEVLETTSYRCGVMALAFAGCIAVMLWLGINPQKLSYLATVNRAGSMLRFDFLATVFIMITGILAVGIFATFEFNMLVAALYTLISVTLISVLALIFTFSSRTAYTIEVEMREQQMETIRREQLQSYKTRARFTARIRDFQERYKQMMGSVYQLLELGQYARAKREIDAINDVMQKEVLVHQEFSNHSVLDAILQSVSNSCQEDHIRFKAKIYIPENCRLQEDELCRLFDQMSKQLALLAKKSGASAPLVEIESRPKDNWVIVQGTADCEQAPAWDEDNAWAEQVLGHVGGVVDFDFDRQAHKFRYSICLPM